MLLLVALAPVASVSATGPDPTLSTGPDYAATIAEIAALTAAIDAGEDVRGPLFDALARLPAYAPRLADDPRARAIRVRAQLDLARVYLGEGQRASAAGIVDEVVRASFGEPIPAAEFGPSLAALVHERRRALDAAGTGSVVLRCPTSASGPVRVYLDERALVADRSSLYLGIYRVAVVRERADVGGPAIERRWIRITQPGDRVVIDCGASPAAPSRAGARGTGARDRTSARGRARVLPRAAEIALVLVGTGLASSGGLALGLGDPRAPATLAAGATLAGLGGVSLAVGAVTLSVDEVRVGRGRGRQALLGWQLRF